MRVEPARVIEFLLLNPTFPQSIRFSLNAAWQALLGIAGDERGSRGQQPGACERSGCCAPASSTRRSTRCWSRGCKVSSATCNAGSGASPSRSRASICAITHPGTPDAGRPGGHDDGGAAATVVLVTVAHSTRIDYVSDVIEGVMDVRLGPLSDDHQRWLRFELNASPNASVGRYLDGFGNAAHLITLRRPHRVRGGEQSQRGRNAAGRSVRPSGATTRAAHRGRARRVRAAVDAGSARRAAAATRCAAAARVSDGGVRVGATADEPRPCRVQVRATGHRMSPRA